MNPRHASAAAILAALAGTAISGRALAQPVQPFPAQFELSSPLFSGGATGFVLNGIDVNDLSGFSVSSAGDINGDGFDDIIIGAYRARVNLFLGVGESYVVFGGPGVGAGGVIELSALNGTNGFVLNGIDTGDQSGISVSSAGDVNADGFDDIIIGAWGADGSSIDAGESYVVFGGAGVGSTGVIELSSLNGTNGFVLNGIDANDESGASVSSAGDVNGDGIDDIIIGAHKADPNGYADTGESYVVFGAVGLGAGGVIELSSLNGSNGFVLNGFGTGTHSGDSVSNAGDVNGDGFDDLIIGARYAYPRRETDAGQSYIVFGGATVGATGTFELVSIDGTNGLMLNGIDPYDVSGFSVSAAGDVNDDGFDDVIIGAHSADPNFTSAAGESYVVYGNTSIGTGGFFITLSTLEFLGDGSLGFIIKGIDANDGSGISVSSAGDVTGDGIDDLIIGAAWADPNGNSYAGESYVVFGRTDLGSSGIIELDALDGIAGFTLNGIAAQDRSGYSVSGAGDVNGDGIDDLIIGAQRAQPNGLFDAGESYVVFGRDNGLGQHQRWINPAGGSWDSGSNWSFGTVPTTGAVVIETPIGVTATGPAGAVFLDHLGVGANLGRTVLDLQPFSLVSVNLPFNLPVSAAMIGSGVFLSNGVLTNAGLISMDTMSLLAPAGISNQAPAEIRMTDGWIQGEVFNAAGATLTVFDGIIDGSLTNSGVTVLSSIGSEFGPVRLEITSSLSNETGGELVLRGVATLDSPGGLQNTGTMSIAFATVDVMGPVHNTTQILPGSALGGSGVIELSSLNGSNGFVLNGISAGDASGHSVSSAGDVNGDGIDDLIIGAFGVNPFPRSDAGASYVVFGGPGVGTTGTIELSTLNGTDGFVLNGINPDDRSGIAVSSAGDMNGDGIDDLIIGAFHADPNGNPDAGECYVVFGAVGLGAGGSMELSSLNGSNGFVIHGIAATDFSAEPVSSAGDVNGDGFDDVLIGAPLSDPNGVVSGGESYVVFGGVGVGAGGVIELSLLDGSNGFVLRGIDTNDRSGNSLASAGDVNGDGIDDLIIGAYAADPGGRSNAGETYVVFGDASIGSGGIMDLTSLNGSNGFVLHGIDANDTSGHSVASGGDLNADGIDDLIIGASGGEPNGITSGESYVIFGAVGVGAGGLFELSSLNGSNGFVLNGIDQNDWSGSSVSSGGDVNGDGIDDVIIGARYADPNGVSGAGECYVVFGAVALGSAGVLELSSLTGSDGFVLNGIDIDDKAGFSVSSAGDLNGDGIDDLIIGAYGGDPSGNSYAGESYVVFGDAGDLASPSLLSISGASSALLTDDMTNETSIVLTDDSALVILGTLTGNGVSGPEGAGTAGTVYVEGGIIPALPAAIFNAARFDGDLDLGPTAHTIIEIGGTSPDIDLGQVATALNLGAAGTLEVRLANGYTPHPGDEYQVLDFATTTGAFTTLILDPGLIAAGADTTELLTTGRIFIAALCPADLNADGLLDNGDIGAFIAFFLAGDFASDMNGDGFLDNGDIGAFVAAFLAGC